MNYYKGNRTSKKISSHGDFFYTFVYSQLESHMQLWSTHLKKVTEQLEEVWKKVKRAITVYNISV